jgi:hypothetical protein
MSKSGAQALLDSAQLLGRLSDICPQATDFIKDALNILRSGSGIGRFKHTFSFTAQKPS